MAKKNKNNKRYTETDYYVKFTGVHLAASGPIVLCKVTTENGTTETYDWNQKYNRDFIRHNMTSNATVFEEKNVPKGRGFDYE